MDKTCLEYPVFICGHRKTGTTLLINLFDGASDAVVYPDDSGFFYLYYPRFDSDKYTRQEKLDRLSEVIIKESLTDVISRPLCSEQVRKDLLNRNTAFYNLVKNYQEEEFTTKEVLMHFIESFRRSFYENIKEPKIWMEKTTSTEIYALEMAELFPRAKFIHLLRDPRDNWASLSSGWEERYKGLNDEMNRLKQSMIERGRLGMELAGYNQESIGADRYKIVRYEDLTTDTQGVMKDLAEFVGIQFSQDLLKPTILSYPWKGNNFEGIKFDKASTVNVNRWKERITQEDAQLIEFHFSDLMKKYNYALTFSSKEAQRAATNHYKWFNFATPYSAK